MSFSKLRAHMDDYLPLVFGEASALDLKPSDQILFVGCGSLPMTAICFALIFECQSRNIFHKLQHLMNNPTEINHQKALDLIEGLTDSPITSKSHITCWDMNPIVVEDAKLVISDLGLTEQINVVCGDGTTARLAHQIDVLCVASMAHPKVAIVENILSQQRQPVRVLLRTVQPQDLRALLYEPFSAVDMQQLLNQIPGLTHTATCIPVPGSIVINSFERFNFFPKLLPEY